MGSSGKLLKLYQQSLIWIFLSHFLISVESGFILNDFIQHFEPVFYNHSDIIEHHRRFKRDNRQDRNEIRIRFNALNRLFKLRLWSDTSIFTEDASLENSEGKPIPFDVSRIYKGELEDDETSHAEGIIKSDGTFEGFIHTPNELYYFDSSGGYFSEPPEFRTIAYRHSEVRYPDDDSCASHHLYLKRIEENRGYCETNLCPSAKDSNSVIQNNILLPEMVVGSHVLLKNNLNDISALRNRSNLVRRKRSQEPLNFTSGGVIDKELYSGWNRGTEGRKRRALIDPKKKTCMLYLQADHLFYNKMGSEEACIESMTRHVQRVNNIYQAIDFDGDGEPDDINFMIKRIKVHTESALTDTNYRYPGNYGVERFLELFSEEDYDAFCLAYMFTYRDFDGGTLGLAWTGDLKNAGGVCEKNGHYRGSLKSLNTGIITLLNYGKHVPPAVSHVTLAHEIGHNFGSPHDPENNKDCTPGGEDGNYIMFARATSGDKKNNNKFSPCSLRSINGVLNAKARDLRGCFTEPKRAICGNGVVDPGEECDCGWEEDCKEACCFPMRSNSATNEKPCTLRPFKLCSPSQGPCCTEECLLKQGAKCREDNGCRDSSYCDGTTAECPLSINKPNKTVCNEEFVCFMGECTGSICLAYGLESCQCLPKLGDPPTKSCELCCKKPGDDQECLSSFEWNSTPYDVPDMLAKPGTPCNNYNGYCDVFQRCREVDPSGPLATLRRLILSDESLATLKVWVETHWYVVMFVAVTLVAALIVVVKIFGKNPPIKRQSKTSRQRRYRNGPNRGALQTRVENGIVIYPTAQRSKIGRAKYKHKKKVKTSKRKSETVKMDMKDKVAVWLENETVPIQTLKKQGSLDSLCDLKSKTTVANEIKEQNSSTKINTENPKKLSRSQSENHKSVERREVFTRSFSHTKNMSNFVTESKSNGAESKLELSSFKESKYEEKQKPQTQTEQSKVRRLPKSKTETAISSKHNSRSPRKHLRSASLQNLFTMIKHQTRKRDKKVIGLGRMKLVLKVNQKPSEKPKKKKKKKQVIVYSNKGYGEDGNIVSPPEAAYQHPVKAIPNISKKNRPKRQASLEENKKQKNFIRQASEPVHVPEIRIQENPMSAMESLTSVNEV